MHPCQRPRTRTALTCCTKLELQLKDGASGGTYSAQVFSPGENSAQQKQNVGKFRRPLAGDFLFTPP